MMTGGLLCILLHNMDKEVVLTLISKGANINALDKDGNTPLKLTLENHQNETAEILKNYEVK